MIFHLGTQWLTFMAILQGSESVKIIQDVGLGMMLLLDLATAAWCRARRCGRRVSRTCSRCCCPSKASSSAPSPTTTRLATRNSAALRPASRTVGSTTRWRSSSSFRSENDPLVGNSHGFKVLTSRSTFTLLGISD